MRVFAAHGDVQRRPQGFRERAEKMRDQLGRQFADAFAVETSLPYEVGPARDVERDLRLGFVHGQQEPIACDAALVAEGFTQRGSQSQGAVLDGVMLVDVQIAAASQIEREAAMLRDLFQHVIEKSQAGDDCAWAFARQIDFHMDVGFLGLAVHLRMPRLPEDAPGDGGPGFVHIAFQAYPKSLQPQIGGEFHVRVAVADHVAACFVDGLRGEVFPHHADPGLAAGTVLAFVMRADAYRLELDSLRLEQVQDEPMRALEILPWKRGSPEAVLIGDHDEGKTRGLEVEQCRYHSGHETYLFQAVYLFVGRLFVQGAVAIKEQYASSAHSGLIR